MYFPNIFSKWGGGAEFFGGGRGCTHLAFHEQQIFLVASFQIPGDPLLHSPPPPPQIPKESRKTGHPTGKTAFCKGGGSPVGLRLPTIRAAVKWGGGQPFREQQQQVDVWSHHPPPPNPGKEAQMPGAQPVHHLPSFGRRWRGGRREIDSCQGVFPLMKALC